MTHLSSTSVALSRLSSSLPNKVWTGFDYVECFPTFVKRATLDPTQVHIQITFSQYSYIDYSHEFVGRALVRFERSTLPDHEGTRTVVLRFLKIFTPVKCVIPHYDGYICCPEEGELHRKPQRNGLRIGQSLWSVNIDRSKPPSSLLRGLRLLWDA